MTAVPPTSDAAPLPDITALEAAHQAAADELDAAKAKCTAACDDANADVAVIDPTALAPAIAAAHVIAATANGEDAVATAAAGSRLVDPQHIALVAKGAAAARDGADVATAVGADPQHVAAVQAVASAHATHKSLLEAAYAKFASAGSAVADARELLDVVARATARGLRISRPGEGA